MSQAAAIAIMGAAALSATGHIKAGNAAKQSFDYQAKINERNAQVAEQEKEILGFQTEEQIGQFADDFAAMQSTVGVAYRKGGVQSGTGTPLKRLIKNAELADKDIQTARYNAELGKRALDEMALQERMQAQIRRMEGRAARTAGYFKAASSLLSGYSKT